MRISKWFFWFFGKRGLCEQGLSFVSEVESRSKKYADTIEEDMKTRFVHSVTMATNGFSRSIRSRREGSKKIGLVVDTSESFIFNLFFLRSCESKSIVPFHQDYKKISLANLINKIENYEDKLSWKENQLQLSSLQSIYGYMPEEDGVEIFDHIHSLFSIIKDGKNGLGIHGFIETIFSEEEYELFKECKLSNKLMVELLVELMFYREESGRKQIPYNSFSPRQLGSIYESFLEYKPFVAETNLYYLKKKTKKTTSWQWVKKSELPKGADPKELYTVKKGEYIFSPDNEERKSTGSYYTPENIVSYIVENTLAPILENKNRDELLEVSVCDPAMGSGHFLVGALNHLAKTLVKNGDERSLSVIKRDVLHSCLFGVDVNPSATKLTKLSLWLATAFPGAKLEHLEDQIFTGDSLATFNWFDEIFNKRNFNGFDAIIGNPPYLKEARNKKVFDLYRKSRVVNYLQGKMDLSYAFVCFSIDLLKERGRIGFIMPSSWFKSEGATVLRDKMASSLDMEKVVDFGNYRVFDSASIQTMIFVASKEVESRAELLYKRMADSEGDLDNFLGRGFFSSSWSGGPFEFVNPEDESFLNKVLSNNVRYISNSEIGSGVDVLQDFLSRKNLKKLNHNCSVRVGDGILVLSDKEVRELKLSAHEKKVLKPYYTPTSLNRYYFNKRSGYKLIYADKQFKRDIKKYPALKKHLDKFKKILTSAFGPYCLHRARKEELFTGKAIFSVRKTSTPAFMYVEEPCYVSRAYLVIKLDSWQESYEYVLGILNSSLVSRWLDLKGKKQGAQLQIDQSQISCIPIKAIDFKNKKEKKYHDRITRYVNEIIALSKKGEDTSSLESKVDSIVYDLYCIES